MSQESLQFIVPVDYLTLTEEQQFTILQQLFNETLNQTSQARKSLERDERWLDVFSTLGIKANGSLEKLSGLIKEHCQKAWNRDVKVEMSEEQAQKNQLLLEFILSCVGAAEEGGNQNQWEEKGKKGRGNDEKVDLNKPVNLKKIFRQNQTQSQVQMMKKIIKDKAEKKIQANQKQENVTEVGKTKIVIKSETTVVNPDKVPKIESRQDQNPNKQQKTPKEEQKLNKSKSKNKVQPEVKNKSKSKDKIRTIIANSSESTGCKAQLSTPQNIKKFDKSIEDIPKHLPPKTQTTAVIFDQSAQLQVEQNLQQKNIPKIPVKIPNFTPVAIQTPILSESSNPIDQPFQQLKQQEQQKEEEVQMIVETPPTPKQLAQVEHAVKSIISLVKEFVKSNFTTNREIQAGFRGLSFEECLNLIQGEYEEKQRAYNTVIRILETEVDQL